MVSIKTRFKMSVNLEIDQKCECGYKMSDAWVVPKSKYSFWGLLIVSFGISHPPIEVRLECDKCGEIFEIVNDRERLKTHAYK